MAERILNKHENDPSHLRLAVRDVLSDTCHDRWTGRGGPTLATFEFPGFLRLWRHQKIPVHADPVDKEETLHYRTVDACQTIRNYLGIFERMWLSMMRCVEACVESH
jgi:hypothetical protein